MTPFQTAWKKTGKSEKGYANNPHDRGGETNHGITVGVARNNGYQGKMIDLTKEQAEQIAKTQYWDIMRLDDVAKLSASIAEEIFDTGFLCGIGNAGIFLQKSLNSFNRSHRATGPDYPECVVDGVVGPGTIYSLRGYLAFRKQHGELVMMRSLNSLQGAYLINIGVTREVNEEFEFGWFLNRVVI